MLPQVLTVGRVEPGFASLVANPVMKLKNPAEVPQGYPE
jgi:hypothetical protein